MNPNTGSSHGGGWRPGTRAAGGLLGALALGVVAGAFLVGRRSVQPGLDAVEARADSEKQQAAENEEPAEKGVVKFTPTALARAGLQVDWVEEATVRSHLQVTGSVQPNVAGLVKITPRVAGKITSVQATIGDTVRARQVLAMMTSTDLAAAQAQYQQAGARVVAAQSNLKRQRQLAGFGEFGQHKVEDARGHFSAAQGDVNEALAEINAARSEVAQSRAALAASRSEQASAESDVAAAETMVEQARTQVEVTESRFNRQETLLKEELTSRQDWEQSRADVSKTRADVQTAAAAVCSAHAKVAAVQAKVEQARAEIETRRAHLQQAQAKRVAALRRLDLARNAQDREERIFRSGVLSSKEVAEAEATLRQAEIDRAAAENAVRLLGGMPGGGDTLAIVAPLSGRITERSVTIGETVAPEKALFTIVNLRSVWVQLAVYQRDLPSVRAGLPVTITTDAVPGGSFVGRVAHVGDTVDETTRTVKIRCVIDNPRGLLKPEMFVRGRIAAPVRSHGIAVPADAVQNQAGKKVVFVPGDHPGEFRAREVEVGSTVDGRTVIIAGLKPRERVVTQNAFVVKAQAMKSELAEE